MMTRLAVVSIWLSVVSLGCGSDSSSSSNSIPGNVTATRGAQKVIVAWDAVNGASSYNLYWATSNGVTKANGTKVAGLTASPYTHTSLTPGTYYYVVTAVAAAGESAESTEVSAPVHLVAFASSTVSGTNGGNLSLWPGAGGHTGTAAGDAVCQSLATTAGLVGTFLAWLSDGTNDAYCRIQGLTGKKSANCGQATLPAAAGPWARMDGSPWANTIDTITLNTGNEDIRAPLLYDENGTATHGADEDVATGTSYDGTANLHCNDWTVNVGSGLSLGRSTGVGTRWTSSANAACSFSVSRLICMQIGTGPALPASTPTTARKAFITSVRGTGNLQSWTQAGSSTGVAAGDAICQSLATTAGLANAGNFKALLGLKDSGLTTGPAPEDRLMSTGPWERVDGVTVVTDKADLTGDSLLTALNVDESGAYVYSGTKRVWTGDHHENAETSVTTTCANWTSELGTDKGYQASILDAGEYWERWSEQECNSKNHLYCFED